VPIGDCVGALIHGHGQLVSHELSAVLKILTEIDGNSWQTSNLGKTVEKSGKNGKEEVLVGG
jgi:hypothetical protein